jgi:predicted dehydrogenase
MTDDERAAPGPDSRVFVNSAIHDYDNARWLLGDEVESIEAVATRQRDPDDDDPIDLALSTFRFCRGGVGNVENVSACRYGYDVRTEIVGTRGTIWIGRQRETDCVVATADGEIEQFVSHWLTRFGDTYRSELEDWVRRTLTGEPPAVTGADGRAALAIAIAATRAYEEGRAAPVEAVASS